MVLLKLGFTILANLIIYGLFKMLRWLTRPLFSPLRALPSPPNKNLLLGNIGLTRIEENFARHDQWFQQYGKVLKAKTFLGQDRLFTIDTRALNHILTHSMDYQKPSEVRYNLARLMGNGILVTESEKHRQQRRILNPSFAPSSIKDLTPIFFEKALRLRDIWKEELRLPNAKSYISQKIDVLSWLSRATLDIIGLAGFNYHFNALNVHQKPNALSSAFAVLLHSGNIRRPIFFLQAIFPILRIIPTKRGADVHKARLTMRQIGMELLNERREGGALQNERDLLSVLIRANTDTNLPESQRMSEDDVLAQVPTFIVAGHETTSTQTTWALFALAQRPDLQRRLREELRSVETDTPSADELESEYLPFLDAVVRETLRLHAAVAITERVAMKDDVIPVEEPYIDRTGNSCREIRIKKGEGVTIPILAMNRSKDIWGEDSKEFNPDRWMKPPTAARDIPGVWGDLMTFLGGARSCIGYRFALVEMKALLFTLLRSFEFSLAVPASEIEMRAIVVTRPHVKGEKGAQMPLMVKVCDTI